MLWDASDIPSWRLKYPREHHLLIRPDSRICAFVHSSFYKQNVTQQVVLFFALISYRNLNLQVNLGTCGSLKTSSTKTVRFIKIVQLQSGISNDLTKARLQMTVRSIVSYGINHSAIYYAARYRLTYMHCRGCANEIINEAIKLNRKETRNDAADERGSRNYSRVSFAIGLSLSKERWEWADKLYASIWNYFAPLSLLRMIAEISN